MMVLVHENHEKCPNVTPVQHFCSGFDHANLVSSFRGFKYLPKLDSVMHIFYNISTQNVLFEKMIIFLSTSGSGSGTFSELAVICAFCRFALAEKRIREQIYFFGIF